MGGSDNRLLQASDVGQKRLLTSTVKLGDDVVEKKDWRLFVVEIKEPVLSEAEDQGDGAGFAPAREADRVTPVQGEDKIVAVRAGEGYPTLELFRQALLKSLPESLGGGGFQQADLQLSERQHTEELGDEGAEPANHAPPKVQDLRAVGRHPLAKGLHSLPRPERRVPLSNGTLVGGKQRPVAGRKARD